MVRVRFRVVGRIIGSVAVDHLKNSKTLVGQYLQNHGLSIADVI